MALDRKLFSELRDLAHRHLGTDPAVKEPLSVEENTRLGYALLGAIAELEQRPSEGFYKFWVQHFIHDADPQRQGSVSFGTNSEEEHKRISACLRIGDRVPNAMLDLVTCGKAKPKLVFEF